MSSGIAKACIIPVCKNRKFNLVHKFPSDKERITIWLTEIQKQNAIPQLQGLTDEAIRKRFFICCRHFETNQYKNIESRSLNLTAIPNLNLTNLDEIHLSKAWQAENNAEIIDELQDTITADKLTPPKPTNAVRILNSGVSLKECTTKQVVRVVKRSMPVVKPQENPQENISATPLKKAKVFDETLINLPDETLKVVGKLEPVSPENDPKTREKPTSVFKSKPESPLMEPVSLITPLKESKRSLPKKKETPKSQKIEQNVKTVIEKPQKTEKSFDEIKPPANKLLALIEVTPDQYEKLSNSLLTSAERNEQITSLMTFFDDTDLTETETDNGNYFILIAFMRLTFIRSFTLLLLTR